MANRTKTHFLDNNCPKRRQSSADWLNLATFAGHSLSGKPFPALGKPFPVYDQGFPPLGKRFPLCGWPFPVLGKPFRISGKPFPLCGKPFLVCGKPFPALGKPFPVSNQSLPEALFGRRKAHCRSKGSWFPSSLNHYRSSECSRPPRAHNAGREARPATPGAGVLPNCGIRV